MHKTLFLLFLSVVLPAADLTTLDNWRPLDPTKPNDWQLAGSVALDPSNPKLFTISPLASTTNPILVNGKTGKTVNLLTTRTHGDIEAYLEFLVPQGSNSGIYFQGLYEIQILDSYGKKELAFGDCGGIYARYINNQVVGGTPPRVNASRSPGEWQSFHVWFRAPRFDSRGQKTQNARFLKVVHNGITIHENVDVDGPTRAAMTTPEAPTGPLMIQGDHGPVALRNIQIRNLP